MYALVLILNETKKLHDVHEILYNEGCGATTLNSRGLGKILIENNLEVPIFAGLRKLVEGDVPYNKTIISVIKDEDKLNKVSNHLNRELKLEDNPGIGFMFVLPVIKCYGANLD